MLTLAAIFAAGVSMLGWYYSDEKRRQLNADNRRLLTANKRLIELSQQTDAALRAERKQPSPEHWNDAALERLAKDVGLHLVDPKQGPREAHSHAEKGQSA